MQPGDVLPNEWEEVQLIQDIINAILLVHIRLTDAVSQKKEKVDKMASCILNLEDALKMHVRSEEVVMKTLYTGFPVSPMNLI